MNVQKTVSIFTMASVIAASGLVSACTGNKETGGLLVGGAAGAAAGSQFGKGTGRVAAGAAGALLGAIIGSQVGRSLDRADEMYMHRTQQNALETAPSGQTVQWVNPDSGHRGTVTPKPAYQAPSGQYCREFQQTVTVGGQTEQAYGTACRQPDGSWKIVN